MKIEIKDTMFEDYPLDWINDYLVIDNLPYHLFLKIDDIRHEHNMKMKHYNPDAPRIVWEENSKLTYWYPGYDD